MPALRSRRTLVRRLTHFGLTALLSLHVLSAAPDPSQQDWNQLMLRGIDANNTGKYLEAERCFTAAIKLMESAGTGDVDLARARYGLAAVLEATGRDRQALPLLNNALRAIEAAPDPDRDEVATVLVELATAYLRTGIYSRAAQIFQRALELQQGAPL